MSLVSALPPGVVYLVGAGPGDPGLVTRRGADLLARADVVVYDGLASPVLLRLAPPGCERVYAGKKRAEGGAPMSQESIERVLIDRARAGKRVVRLKGGDPFVFGRGAEECAALAAAGVRYEVVPGVSAATAVPAYAGIPLTARGVASTVAFATGHEAHGVIPHDLLARAGGDRPGGAAGDGEPAVDWGAVARADTIVLFMALATAADCCARLVAAGRDPATPAAAIHWGTTASQRVVVATLGGLADAIAAAGLRPPSLLVIGPVVALREELRWFDRRPLAGARVLVTRAADQAGRFADAVAELGGDPLVAPLVRVAPTGALEQVADFAAYAWLVFTSASAVDCTFAELDRRGLDARALAGARLACVGGATAAALARHGVRADVVPAHGDAAGVARAVAAAAGGALAGARVLLPRAERGREEAIDLFAAAGADVHAVAAYRLEPVPADDPSVAHALDRLRRREVHAVAFFAPSQVRALWDLLGDGAAAVLADVRLLAAIGATTAAALAERGLTAGVVASAPDAEVLAGEMAAALANEV
jgi:uroporphyrinogen III methyltransferase/synthase